jgi:hypothetical protein
MRCGQGRKQVIPAQVGSRAGDDADLRRRLVLVARLTAVVAAVVLAAGFALVAFHRSGEGKPAAGPADTPATRPAPLLSTESGPVNAADPTPRGTLTSPVLWRVQSTRDRAKDAAIAGYKDYMGTAVRLGETPDPADPALPQVALDPELSRFRQALSVSSDAQTSRRGRVTVNARLLSLNGTQAIVVGCADSSAQQLFDGSRRRTAWRGGIVVTAAELRWQAGRWRVYQVNPMARSRCLR